MAVNPDILCKWLGLPQKCWPPDHHTLLGLPPGEADPARIEQHVHEKMAKLRCYQISHPDEATEGMNRLAQAFISLTEAASRAPKPPPPTLPPKPAPALTDSAIRKAAAKTPKPGDTAVLDQTKLDWRTAPPPVRAAGSNSGTIPAVKPGAATDEIPIAQPATPPPPVKPPVDPDAAMVHELARSQEARAEIGTLGALVERIDQTRQLLAAWERLGRHLRAPLTQPLTPAEQDDFVRRLRDVQAVMAVYPKFVGHPGKPGYRVVALARLAMTHAMFRNMDPGQREQLVRDWENGGRVLRAHRSFLRTQFKSLRRKGTVGLALRAVGGTISDHPYAASAAVAGLAALYVYLMVAVF